MAVWRTTVDIQYPGAGSPGTNTWLFRNAPTDSDPSVGHSALQAFYDELAGLTLTSVSFSSTGDWTRVSGSDGAAYSSLDSWRVPGTASGALLPPFCAIGLVEEVESLPRKRWGRAFLGPVAGGNSGNTGQVFPSTRTAVVDAAEGNLVEGLPSGGGFVVYSRTDGLYRDITGFSVPADFWSLTSRRD